MAQDRIGFVSGTIACTLGIFLGDVWLYLSGRWFGRPWLGRAPLKWLVSPEAVARSARWFERRGALVIFLSRFIPGTRLPTYLAAGILRMSFWRFTVALFVPVALWTPLLVGLAWLLGEQVFGLFERFSRYAIPGMVAALVLVWTVVAVGGKLVTHEGRRQLVGWWRRKVAWEFWPPWAFYPPVVLYVLWLGLRYRSLTLFTLANPAIPASGFIGESKSAILGALDPATVARYRVIAAELPLAEKLAAVQTFQDELGLGFPIVLKPDAGQRGQGVTVARTSEEVEQYFRRSTGDAIVQEHVAGAELGIFYVRMPGQTQGEVFAITDKRLPEVAGDGRRSLARLILDDRARSRWRAPTSSGKKTGSTTCRGPASGSSWSRSVPTAAGRSFSMVRRTVLPSSSVPSTPSARGSRASTSAASICAPRRSTPFVPAGASRCSSSTA
ncbi:MAG: hypothetical protein HC897_10155 [Thermoanaerobaculia bacterium]|nr:hypothetical protein [Thermoanaerobaculia bacterium]